MRFDPSWFVDRDPVLVLFNRMLAGDTSERILCITAEMEHGKTWLLWRMRDECKRRSVPVILLDFDLKRSGMAGDYLGIAREFRHQLSEARTPAICECEDAMFHPAPLVDVRTGAGHGGVDWGKGGRFAHANVSEVPGRDSIHVNVGDIHAGSRTPEQEVWQKEEMGRALCRDLARLGRVVLLVDTFECAFADFPEACTWLERWVFRSLCRDLPYALLVVAGRPECRSFFDQPRLWGDLVIHIDRFDPFSRDEALTYYRRRNLPVDETDTLFLQAACSKAGLMAQLGDAIRQERGGMR